jgi:hypothetical protein
VDFADIDEAIDTVLMGPRSCLTLTRLAMRKATRWLPTGSKPAR